MMYKRLFDIVFSFIALVILGSLIIVIYFLVLVSIGVPVLYRQKRSGRSSVSLRMFKLRTMTDARDADGNLLPDAKRLTPFGRFLRATSLDELPEVINIIKGDMSIVRPRPILMQYLDRYTPEQARRHAAKPGITGSAQINDRNAIRWEEKFELDLWLRYVDHHRFRRLTQIFL